jgi:hypothetical protein
LAFALVILGKSNYRTGISTAYCMVNALLYFFILGLSGGKKEIGFLATNILKKN